MFCRYHKIPLWLRAACWIQLFDCISMWVKRIKPHIFWGYLHNFISLPISSYFLRTKKRHEKGGVRAFDPNIRCVEACIYVLEVRKGWCFTVNTSAEIHQCCQNQSETAGQRWQENCSLNKLVRDIIFPLKCQFKVVSHNCCRKRRK